MRLAPFLLALCIALPAAAAENIAEGWRLTSGLSGGNDVGYVPRTTPPRLQTGAGATPGMIGPEASIEVQVTGIGGVPAIGVSAVVLNVTATNASAPTYVTVWPSGSSQPTASNLNLLPGETRANLVVAGTDRVEPS